MSVSFTNCEALKSSFHLSFPRDGVGISTLTDWLADWRKNKREPERTLDSLFALQLPHSTPPFNMAPLYISPWQLQCMCVRVCVWGESHDFSATSLRDSRHVQMVLVLALNEVPDTEQWSHWTQWFQGGSGREATQPSVGLSSTVCARCTKPVGKCEEAGSFFLSFT